MLSFYIQAFLQKCRHKHAHPEEFKHVTWKELLGYTLRQAFHNYRGTYTASIECRRFVAPDVLCMGTPYGDIFLPRATDKNTLRYLLREAFDTRHWHQYRTACTPLGPEDIVVDCGPSEGLWALSVVHRVKKIYLVEPQRAYTELLWQTFSSHIGAGRVEIINSAVGNKDGRCRIEKNRRADTLAVMVPDENGGTAMARLDTLFKDRPVTFIKADIEGAEMALLEGAHGLLQRDRPKLALTVYHEQNDWRVMRDHVMAQVPQYHWRLKGMLAWGKPLMLHMWVPGAV